MIIIVNRNEELSNRVHHKELNKNSSKAAEVVVLLELVAVIVKKSKHVRDRKIIVALDCREAHEEIAKEMHKDSKLSYNRGE